MSQKWWAAALVLALAAALYSPSASAQAAPTAPPAGPTANADVAAPRPHASAPTFWPSAARGSAASSSDIDALRTRVDALSRDVEADKRLRDVQKDLDDVRKSVVGAKWDLLGVVLAFAAAAGGFLYLILRKKLESDVSTTVLAKADEHVGLRIELLQIWILHRHAYLYWEAHRNQPDPERLLATRLSMMFCESTLDRVDGILKAHGAALSPTDLLHCVEAKNQWVYHRTELHRLGTVLGDTSLHADVDEKHKLVATARWVVERSRELIDAAKLSDFALPVKGKYELECKETFAWCLFNVGNKDDQTHARNMIEKEIIPELLERAAELKTKYGIP